jgi:hypothetical protein
MLYVHIAEPHHRELPECAKEDSTPTDAGARRCVVRGTPAR